MSRLYEIEFECETADSSLLPLILPGSDTVNSSTVADLFADSIHYSFSRLESDAVRRELHGFLLNTLISNSKLSRNSVSFVALKQTSVPGIGSASIGVFAALTGVVLIACLIIVTGISEI